MNALDFLLVSEAPAERLDACLTHLLPALAAWEGPVNFRLLVNGGPPGALAGLEAAGDAGHSFRVLITRVPAWIGRPAAFNWLLTESTAPWVALMTDDVRVPPDALNRLVATLRRQPEAVAVGGPMTPVAEGVHQVFHPGDGLVLYRRSAFEAVPRFDIRYTPGSLERLDHALALGMAGRILLVDAAVACRTLGAPAREPERVGAELHSGRMKLFGKWGDDILGVMEQRLAPGVDPAVAAATLREAA